MCNWRAESDIRRAKKITLYAARRALQKNNLIFEQLQPVFDLQRFFNGKYNSRKLQEVVADRLCQIKTRIPENAAEPHHVWRVFSGKVHEFHSDLL